MVFGRIIFFQELTMATPLFWFFQILVSDLILFNVNMQCILWYLGLLWIQTMFCQCWIRVMKCNRITYPWVLALLPRSSTHRWIVFSSSLFHSLRKIAPNHWCLGNVIFFQAENFVRYVLPFFFFLLYPIVYSFFFLFLLCLRHFHFNVHFWILMRYCKISIILFKCICISKHSISPRMLEEIRNEST